MVNDLCNSILSSRNAPVESSTKKLLKTSTHSSSHKEVCVVFLFRALFLQLVSPLTAASDLLSVLDGHKLSFTHFYKNCTKSRVLYSIQENVTEGEGERGTKYLWSLELLAVGSHHYAKILPEEQERKH